MNKFIRFAVPLEAPKYTQHTYACITCILLLQYIKIMLLKIIAPTTICNSKKKGKEIKKKWYQELCQTFQDKWDFQGKLLTRRQMLQAAVERIEPPVQALESYSTRLVANS